MNAVPRSELEMARRAGTARKLPTIPVHESPDGVREEAKPSLRSAWVVFARRRYDEPLYQVGTVTADDPDMAVVFARSIYDEHPWIEMVVAPRSEMRTVIPA